MLRLSALLLLLPLTPVLAESAPGEAALGYLKVIASGKDPLPATAIADGVTSEKLASIRERLRRLSLTLSEGDLRVLESRTEGDLAAVMISQISHFDPSGVQVHAIGLLKRGERWLPAPVPASFENTGIDYLPDLGPAAAELRRWMLTRRTAELTSLRANVQRDLLSDIRAALHPDTLLESTPDALVAKFLHACQHRDLPTALALLGGLEDPLPESWQETLTLTLAAFRDASKAPGDWPKIIATRAAIAFVNTDMHASGATVSAGYFDPSELRRRRLKISILHFPLDQTAAGSWRLRLPSWLREDGQLDQDNPMDQGLVERFPAALLEAHPAAPAANPAELATSLAASLTAADFPAILKGFDRDLPPVELIDSAAQLFRTFEDAPARLPLILSHHISGDSGLLLLATFDSRSPAIIPDSLTFVPLCRRADGWFATPQSPAEPELDRWKHQKSELSQTAWLGQLAALTSPDELPARPAPSEDDARHCAERFLSAIRDRDVTSLLATSLTVEDADQESPGSRLLRQLGHELTAGTRPELTAIHRRGRWAVMTVRHRPAADIQPPYLLHYPILDSRGGPRVLADTTFFTPRTRTRKYLNGLVWERLASQFPKSDIADLRAIDEELQTLAP